VNRHLAYGICGAMVLWTVGVLVILACFK